jgi:photosystem II stability/assembly factor-like uncharacterized protein
MDDGYAIALSQGAVLQGGSWNDGGTIKPAVFKSTNDGVSWQRFGLVAEQGLIKTLSVAPTALSTVYAGGYSYDAGSIRRPRLFKSTDVGSNWTAIGTATLNTLTETIECVTVDAVNSSRVLVGTTYGVLISTDAGVTWAKQGQSYYVRSLLAHPTQTGKFYMGTASGVWESTNGGQNWTQINNGLSNLSVLTLAFDGTNKKLFAGTDGGGVFRLDLLTDVPDGHESVPGSFALRQNYPNPFNPTTAVSCQWPVASEVRLVVYDILGREVAILANGRYPAGQHDFTFGATGLASGTYVCRLYAAGGGESHSESIKMILTR